MESMKHLTHVSRLRILVMPLTLACKIIKKSIVMNYQFERQKTPSMTNLK